MRERGQRRAYGGKGKKRRDLLWKIIVFALVMAAGTGSAEPVMAASRRVRAAGTGIRTAAKTVETAEEERQAFRETEDSLLSEMDLKEVQKAVDELLQEQKFSFGEMVRSLMSGEEELGIQELGKLAGGWMTEEFRAQKSLLVQTILLVLAGALLSGFSGLFGGEQLTETSFYLIYLLLFTLLLRNFQSVSENLAVTLEGLVGFMKILTPSYYLAVAAASGVSTATMFYQIVLLVILVVEKVMASVLLPAIHVYILLALVNHLSREEFLSHMTELLESAIQWTMKSALGVLVGLQIIRSLIAPALDTLRRTAIGKTAGAIPGVGNAINAVTELVIGSAVLIRNCFGVTAMLVLLAAGVTPLLRMLLGGLSFRVLAAVSQPVSDKRIAGCLATMGKGYGLLLQLLLTVEILFLLTIAILAGTFS